MTHSKKLRNHKAEILAIGLMIALTGRAWADPGELFPNVAPYEDTVNSPVSHPEKAVKKHRAVAPPVETPAAPQPEPATAPTTPAETVKPVVKTKPEKTKAPVDAAVVLNFHPYGESVSRPLLNDTEQQTFDKLYADNIRTALAGSLDDRRKLADELTTVADSVDSPDLHRYLLLNAMGLAIRAAVPADDRAARANKLLPLLTGPSLAVAQARVDCLTDLMLSMTVSPTDTFYDMYAESYADLAKLQVQAGFPREAQASLKKAREAAAQAHNKTPARADQLGETTACADRSLMASGLWPRWQQTLASNPADAFANTQCALLHLSLYGSPAHAAPFAEKSDKKELNAFAAAYKTYAAAGDADTSAASLNVLAVCNTLLEVARNVATQPFDKYSIAFVAGDKAQTLLDSGLLPSEKQLAARATVAGAKSLIEKGNLRPGNPPKWLGGSGTTSTAAVASADKGDKPDNQPFGSVADIFKDAPKDLLPNEASNTGFRDSSPANKWLVKNTVGKQIVLMASAQSMDPAVIKEDGTRVIPVNFTTPKYSIQGCVVSVEITAQMAPAVAERAGNLQYGESAKIGGTITSATMLRMYGSSGSTLMLRLVLGEKPADPK